MLNDDDRTHGRIVSIDPGSTTLGVAIIDYHPFTMEIVKSFSFTLNVGRMPLNTDTIEKHSDRYARIFMLMDLLVEIFIRYSPNHIVSESPFLKKRFPLAFAVLTEVVLCIRMAVKRYDAAMRLDMVEPSKAKAAVGAVITKGKEQKEPVRLALLAKLKELCFDRELSDTDFELLDEHSIDAIAVGYCKLEQLRTQ